MIRKYVFNIRVSEFHNRVYIFTFRCIIYTIVYVFLHRISQITLVSSATNPASFRGSMISSKGTKMTIWKCTLTQKMALARASETPPIEQKWHLNLLEKDTSCLQEHRSLLVSLNLSGSAPVLAGPHWADRYGGNCSPAGENLPARVQATRQFSFRPMSISRGGHTSAFVCPFSGLVCN